MNKLRKQESFRNLFVGLVTGLALLLMAALLSSPLKAQTTYGSIVGNVTDASGAIIPGATITLTNLGTNERHTAESDASGSYRFVNLLPANYKLEVEKSGFKRLTREPVMVQVQSVVRIDAAMEVGAVTEVVEVSAQTPLLQTESASLGGVVEGQQVQQMPLNGRNVVNLIAMTPGVVPQGSSMGGVSLNQTDHTNPSGWGNFQIGGGYAASNAMYVDGGPINVLMGNAIGLVITQDAVQEFNVSTNSTSAEFGRTGGGVVNMATKSGSNSFHGSVYEYFRNSALNANKWELNLAGTKKALWNQNQYGVTFGGPIKKDKLFFFFSWEGFKSRLGVTATTWMPTEQEAAGLVSAALSPTTLSSLGVSSSCYSISGSTTQIVSSCISPTAKWYLNNYFNKPNNVGKIAGINFVAAPVIGDDYNQYTGRVDYNISDKQRLFGRYTNWRMFGMPQNRADRVLSADSSSKALTTQVVVGDTYTFTPTTVLDVRLFFFRNYVDDMPTTVGYDLSQIDSVWKTIMPQMTKVVVPALSFSNLSVSLYGGQRGGLALRQGDTVGLSASVSKMRGTHNLKVGTELRLMDKNVLSGGTTNGQFNFNATSTVTGNYWSDFLLGFPQSTTIKSASPISNYNYFQGYYVTDSWQVNRKLTLNLGLRWELPGAIAERHDRNTVLLPTTVDPVTGATGTLALVNSAVYSNRTSVEAKHNLFAPRIGLAYRITDNTVLRAGYGISYLSADMQGSVGGDNSVINSATHSWSNTTTYSGCTWVYATFANPFPSETCSGYAFGGGVPVSTGRNDPNFMKAYYSPSQTIAGAYPYTPFPYTQQWNLSIGHQFAGDTMVDIGYAGSRGTHLPNPSINLNQLPHYSEACRNAFTGATNDCYWDANWYRSYIAGGSTNTTTSYFQKFRPYPYYNGVNNVASYAGNSFYHSMQVKAQKRFKSGGLLMAMYTWGKMIANIDGGMSSLETKPGVSTASGGTQSYQDYTNLFGERSLSDHDIPHRFLLSYVVSLPFGEGKKYGSGVKGVVGKLVSGWGVNGITTFQSGFPLVFFNNYQLNNLGAGTGRPNVVPGCVKEFAGPAQTRLNSWFNTSCYAALGSNFYGVGNQPRIDPVLRAAGVNNWDLSVLKTTKVKESVTVDFRAEAFNIFNRVQFARPDTNVSSTTFGQTHIQQNQPRLIQFSLRVNF